MDFSLILKRSVFFTLFITFFIASGYSHASSEDLHSKLSESPSWKNLVHYFDGNLAIEDNEFILSLADFSLNNELVLTLKLLREGNEKSCKFVARHYYLSKFFHDLPKLSCPDYENFRKKVPFDEVSVIYASENLSQPSSMMGHGMLALTGLNDKKINVAHSVSFFTDLDSLNLLTIMWETLYVGKQGHFVVKPLEVGFNFYLKDEERNVWKYVIDLTAEERDLIHRHIWELKYADIDYLFHEQNCATLSQQILSIVKTELTTVNAQWVSPIDLAKTVNDKKIVKNTLFYPSNKWKIRLLSDQIPNDSVELLLSDSVAKNLNYLEQETLKTYNNYQYQERNISKESWEKKSQSIYKLYPEQLSLNLESYKSPLSSPADSQVSIGSTFNGKVRLEWLPAAHSIEDDNRQYFTENELKLFNIKIDIDPNSFGVSLKEFNIYSARSLTPSNKLLGGTSGSFKFGFQRLKFDKLNPFMAFNVQGGLGKTYSLSRDIKVFALFNIGGFTGVKHQGVVLTPEIGGYIYEIFDMKSIVSYQRSYSHLGQLDTYSLSQSWFLSKNNSIVIEANHQVHGSKVQTEGNIRLKFYY